MAYLHRALKVPAILRALADVAEQHCCVSPSLVVHESFDVLQSFSGNERTMALSFTGDFMAKKELFLRALGRAYRGYGGDPSVFLTEPELYDMVVGPDDVARPAEVQS